MVYDKKVSLEIPIEQYGYPNYTVICDYYPIDENTYSVAMWLMRKDLGDKYEVDKQSIHSVKEDIEIDICRLVKQVSLSGFLEKYINRITYICKCFDIGNSYLNNEKIDIKDFDVSPIKQGSVFRKECVSV